MFYISLLPLVAASLKRGGAWIRANGVGGDKKPDTHILNSYIKYRFASP